MQPAAFSSDKFEKQSQITAEHGGGTKSADSKTSETAAPNGLKVRAKDDEPAPNQNRFSGDGKGLVDEVALVIAFLTFCALVIQTVIFGLQAKRLKETVSAMREIDLAQGTRMDESLRLAGIAAKASAQSTELTKKTLMLAQRPKIRVGNIWAGNSTWERPAFYKHSTIVIQFDYDNIGGTNAFIKDADAMIVSNETGLPYSYPIGTRRNPQTKRKNKNSLIEPKALAPGEMDSGVLNGKDHHLFQGDQADALGSGRAGFYLFVIGWIEYADDLGIVRRTRFARRYDHPSGRFLPVSDPDYEYEA